MKTLGIDIGTTTISVVAADETGVLSARNMANDTFLRGQPWERTQDPARILEKVMACAEAMLEQFPDIQAIGVTGQMHGILYLDKTGTPVSPLYTWQDGRGSLPWDGQTSWAAQLSRITGYPLASGYGMVTHYYNSSNDLVPSSAAVVCTIHDYIAMRLAGLSSPRMDASDAASLGLYDCVHGCFDKEALGKAGMDDDLIPVLAQEACLGTGPLGVPVYAAIGDNQASFLGATEGRRDALLVNMGTGGQVAVYTPDHLQAQGLETRPYPGGGWLLVGASLCGGRSYALLEGFFRETAAMITGEEIPAYDAMARVLAAMEKPRDLPQTRTTFQGTRQEPALRGSISGLTPDNFTPRHLIWSMMEGMARELYDMYQSFLAQGGRKPGLMIGSGNGLRKNPWLRRVFEEVFGCPMILSTNQEEAAFGAALHAASALAAER